MDKWNARVTLADNNSKDSGPLCSLVSVKET